MTLISRGTLKSNKFYSFLEQLLVGDFEGFHQASKESLNASGINIGQLERNVKIQAIPRILNGIKIASYSQVSEILRVPKGEVESYII